jgi:hypothetical protein
MPLKEIFSGDVPIEITQEFLAKHGKIHEKPKKLVISLEVTRPYKNYEISRIKVTEYSSEGRENIFYDDNAKNIIRSYYHYPEVLDQFFTAIEKPMRLVVLEALFHDSKPRYISIGAIEDILIYNCWRIIRKNPAHREGFKERFGRDPTYEEVEKVWVDLDDPDGGILSGPQWRLLSDQISLVKAYKYVERILDEIEDNYDDLAKKFDEDKDRHRRQRLR